MYRRKIKWCNPPVFKKHYLYVVAICYVFYMLYLRSICDLTPPICNNVSLVKNSTLPKILHVQSKFVVEHKTSLNVTVMVWDDRRCRTLIKTKFNWFLPYYDNYRYNIQRVDAARYFILYEYGGLYMDMDYEVLKNFWDFIPDDKPSVVESPYKWNEEIQNSMMSSQPKHRFWNITFDLLVERAKSSKVLWSTGPSMLQDAVYIANEKAMPIYILPCENFHRIPFGEWGYSPYTVIIAREFMGRFYGGKYCGYKEQCEFARHHNKVGYLYDVLSQYIF